MIKLFEMLSFAISVIAFGYGVGAFYRQNTLRYFQLYVCAAGCYMLEELWVIVNSLFGNGSQDGLVTVRLIGFFGCLCFMLSANLNEFDEMVEEKKNVKAEVLALQAPAVLLALYALYAFSGDSLEKVPVCIIGLLSISPALAASYFSLKHLLLPDDSKGLLKRTRAIDITALVFYAVNYIYPFLNLHCSQKIMCICDVAVSGILLGIMVLCRRGGKQWAIPT